MAQVKVGVLMGGMGSEREISFKTGAAFLRSVQALGYPHEVIDCGPDLPRVLTDKKIDVALLALHGKYGEDGTVQGILEYLKIPYSGSGVLASSLAMNKLATKQILQFWGVPSAPFQVIDLKEQKIKEVALKGLELPVVVKPVHEGSSVGMSIVKNQRDLLPAVELAAKYEKLILVEKYIDGVEITIPIWMGKVLPEIEIVPKTEWYDYERKYTPGLTDHIMPARISDGVRKKCQQYALDTFKALGCRHYGRVDIRIDKQGHPFVLEINTLPGCTETSLFPESAAHAGIKFDEVIKTLIENATLDYR